MNRWNNIKMLAAHLPIGLCAICVGFCTLGNIFILLGFHYVKTSAVAISILVIIGMVLKLLVTPKRVWEELQTPHIGCFYPTFGMLLMVLGSHFLAYNDQLGKSLWLAGIGIDTIIIAIFTYFHVLRNFSIKAVSPGWFVAFVGILVAGVTSPGMGHPLLVKVIFLFALSCYLILLPLIIYRVLRNPVEENIYPSLAIFPAPPSLCLVTYLTIFERPNFFIATTLFLIIQGSLLIVYFKLSAFFHLTFTHAFASLTFPLAISCLALIKYSGYVDNLGLNKLSGFLGEVAALELLIDSAVIIAVIYQVFHLLKFEHRTRKDQLNRP